MQKSELLKYYSESWLDATNKFISAAAPLGWQVCAYSDDTEYKIPVVRIGHGADKIVINSGIHGIEGFFGSAAQLLMLSEINKLKREFPEKFAEVSKKFTIVFIHVINGWGMDNRMRENRSNVDLNRNQRADWETPAKKNRLYEIGRDLVLSNPCVRPGESMNKFQKICEFKRMHNQDGAWRALVRGQDFDPDGIAYSGTAAEPETKMLAQIYDNLMKDAKSLLGIGLHTGLGKFRANKGLLTRSMLVSHPDGHPNTEKFREIFAPDFEIVADDGNLPNAAALSGDLVDLLEIKYADKNRPVWTADLEIGTGTWNCSAQTKMLDRGDARWEMMNLGHITKKTWNHLTENWYPSNPLWREMAMQAAGQFWINLSKYMENQI
jgi:hypothetical protein